jgi:hypothetical protein
MWSLAIVSSLPPIMPSIISVKIRHLTETENILIEKKFKRDNT